MERTREVSPPRVAAEGGIACGYICQRVQIVGSINISGRNETSYLQHLLTAFLFHTNFTPNPLKITLLATSAPAIPRLSFIPRHQRAGIHSARRASAPRSPMLLEWRSSRSKLPLLLRLAARAWPLGGVGGTLGIDSSPHLPKHRTHIRGNLHCGSSQTNNKWTESPYHLSKTVCKVRVRVSTTRSLEGVWLYE